MHLILQKAAWEAKKSHMREENLQTTQTISKHKWTNALGFELQSASNLHRDKKITSFEPQSAPNLHRDKKNKGFELQSAPNLHRDKKKKNFGGIVASSQVDCKVFVFLFFLSLCRFGALWSSKLLFFSSLCRFGALWSSKVCLFLSMCRFDAL